MATMQELEQAMIKAHEAGDTNAARFLAGEISKAQGLSVQAPVKPPGAGERFMRGMNDTGTGLVQLWKMATNPEEAKRYTAEVNAETADYEKRRGKDAGIDWLRIAGNVVSTAPAMFVPGGQATLPARLGVAALSGGLVGGAQFSKTGDWSDKVAQSVVGAGAGALGQGAVEGVTKIGGAVVNKVAQALSKAPVTDDAIAMQFKTAGVDWDALADKVKQSLLADARKALSAGGKLDPETASRKAAADQLGVQLTQGQLTRNPRQWTVERDVAKLAGVGDEVSDRFVAQEQALVSAARGVQRAAKGSTNDPAMAADAAMKALRSFDESNVSKERALWDAARESLGGEVNVPMQSLAQKYGQLLDDVPDLIPAGVKARMEKFGLGGGTQTKAFTVNDADSLIKQLNRYYDRNNEARNRALGELKQAVNATLDDFDPAAQKIGAEAVAKFRAARDVSREIRQTREATPGLQAALDDADPARFLNRYVFGADPRSIANLKKAMLQANGGEQAWNDLRGEVVNRLMRAGVNQEGDRFMSHQFAQELNRIGQSRLKELFSPAELSQINLIARVGKLVKDDPAGAAINRSNTAAALLNTMQRIGEVPYFGPMTAPINAMVVRPIANQMRRNAAIGALSPELPVIATAPMLTPAMQDQLRAILSRSVVPSAAAAAAYNVSN